MLKSWLPSALEPLMAEFLALALCRWHLQGLPDSCPEPKP